MQHLAQSYGNSDEDSDDGIGPKPASVSYLKPKVTTRPIVAAPYVPPNAQAPHQVAVLNPISRAAIGAGPLGASRSRSGAGGEQLMLMHNPTAEAFLAPMVGPAHPFRNRQEVPAGGARTGAGVMVRAAVEDWSFQDQYNTYQQHGFATDAEGRLIGDVPKAKEIEDASAPKRDKKRKKVWEPGEDEVGDDISTGVWAPDPNAGVAVTDLEKGTMTKEQTAYREAHLAAKAAKNKEYNMEEDHDRRDERKMGHVLPPRHNRDTTAPTATTVFHGKAERSYAGKSWVEPPAGAREGTGDHQAFPPKKCIHRWTGHTKGVQAIRFFPGYGHLLLSGSMDSKIKIWDVTGDRTVRRTYSGHTAAVRDVAFNNDGSRFLSAGYDRFVQLWDTETGQVISTFTNRKMPYCATFYPLDNDIFLAGCSDNKIVQWDAKSGEVVQEYNHHLAPVNTVLFSEEATKFISTSDDKKVLVWEYNIPVPVKYIAEPHMHSMPATAIHPSGSHWVGQSLDNQIMCYGARDKYSLNRKKVFKGHVCAGYACKMDFSPNGKYLTSGDGEGNLFVWDWGSTKVYRKLQAHTDGPCIDVKWHPVEGSWVASAGWDGIIKLWD